MKDKTSAGLSRLHFGYLKACAFFPLALDVEATMGNIQYILGYSPICWKKSVNLMLQKKNNKSKSVENVRTIQLFESDYNFNNNKIKRRW